MLGHCFLASTDDSCVLRGGNYRLYNIMGALTVTGNVNKPVNWGKHTRWLVFNPDKIEVHGGSAVSYTHLTLPTICSV